jgi:altronate hydrolase
MSDSLLVKLPTTENAVIRLHESDNIAVARVPLSPGFQFTVSGNPCAVREPVPPGHKIALKPIHAGHPVTRWGQMIGLASQPIETGEHVHVHNLAYEERAIAYEFPSTELPLPAPSLPVPSFLGYLREDGRAGTRNYIAVVAASNCASYAVSLAVRAFESETLPPNVDGVAAFPIEGGCGIAIGPDTDQLERTLGGVMNHPNVAGAVLVGLGCEVNQIGRYFPNGAARTRRVAGLTLQGTGGTRAAIEATRREVWKMIERTAEDRRVEISASSLVLGLQCGGSDSFSGITANPALGHCSDLLVACAGTTVLAETPETFGAEHLLVQRCRSRAVAERYLGFVESYKAYLRHFDSTFDDNPSPGNKDGGLTTILEKSLGAVIKAGTTPMMDAVEYAAAVRTPGFVFMNTPGYDPASLAGLAAGGANIFAFTTGRGSATGFPTAPVIKISSNSHTYRRMQDDMDVNAGRIADGEATVEEVGREIFDLLLRVASGERTCSERLGHNEFVPWRIGPVL